MLRCPAQPGLEARTSGAAHPSRLATLAPQDDAFFWFGLPWIGNAKKGRPHRPPFFRSNTTRANYMPPIAFSAFWAWLRQVASSPAASAAAISSRAVLAFVASDGAVMPRAL